MDLRGFLGGHPLAVFVRLAVISLLTGVVLSALGITPANFFQTLDDLARWIYDLGFASIDWLLQYLVLGAMVVVPIWLLARLLRSRGIKTD
ncbi:MAG TPA: DUF6460 domain-containing protein [Hyphomicrobium sp.]|nr:DUF6460 domain-containing protein [Hyphomicrobium sp.]